MAVVVFALFPRGGHADDAARVNGETSPEVVSVCSLAEAPETFLGRRLVVESELATDNHHFWGLVDPTCKSSIPIDIEGAEPVAYAHAISAAFEGIPLGSEEEKAWGRFVGVLRRDEEAALRLPFVFRVVEIQSYKMQLR